MPESRQWLFHPKPLPDELLSSWIVRAARSNCLKIPTFCHLVWPDLRQQLWTRDVDGFSDPRVIAGMAEGTGTDLSRAQETTLGAYEDWLFEQHVPHGKTKWLLRIGVYHRSRLGFGMQFCPACLAADPVPYFRRIWRVAFSTCCPVHECLLADRCPGCGDAVSIHRLPLLAPDLATCPNCWTSLANRSPPAALPATLSFESAARDVLEKGWTSMGEYGPVRSTLHFDVVHQLARLLSTGARSHSLRSHIASNWGGAPEAPLFNGGAKEIEEIALPDRHRLLQLVGHLMAEWPRRLLRACKESHQRWSEVTKDMTSIPYALYRPIRLELYGAAAAPDPN